MHAVVGCNFLNGFLTLDRLQRDSCFHFRAETPSLPRFHSYSVRGSRFYTLFTGPNFGEQLRCLPYGTVTLALQGARSKLNCIASGSTVPISASLGCPFACLVPFSGFRKLTARIH